MNIKTFNLHTQLKNDLNVKSNQIELQFFQQQFSGTTKEYVGL